MCNIAVISVHTSPLAQPGTRDTGGMNVYIRELSRQLRRRAHPLDIFTRRSDPGAPAVTAIDPRIRVIQVDAGAPETAKADLRRYLGRFRDGVLRFQRQEGVEYDLVHSHYWLAGRSESDTLVELYGVSPRRIAVVPGGVDTERFRPMGRARARRRLGLDRCEPLVLFVGRIEPLKGIDVLLRAAASLEGPLRLLIVGGDHKDRQRKSALRSLARELGISTRVTFRDAVPHEALHLYYNAADVCAVPSYYESFGLVAVEAMACGTPVVASRVGGLKETVQDGRTGYLAPWRCPEPFAERLDLLLRNEALRRSLGRGARAAAQRFHWPIVATRIEEVYHELVSQYRGVAVSAHVA